MASFSLLFRRQIKKKKRGPIMSCNIGQQIVTSTNIHTIREEICPIPPKCTAVCSSSFITDECINCLECLEPFKNCQDCLQQPSTEHPHQRCYRTLNFSHTPPPPPALQSYECSMLVLFGIMLVIFLGVVYFSSSVL